MRIKHIQTTSLSIKKWVVIVCAMVLGLMYIFCLPRQLFDDSVSTVLLDRNGKLLGAKIAKDMQWRFPPVDSVPQKFQYAITTFEDKRFRYHPGVDPIAIVRAVYQNITYGGIHSGASTLTMQVIRLARKGQPRTWGEKITEIIWATRLELSKTKAEIMALYASHAPFGGNIVGLDAAAWKYFGRSSTHLSWAETATLAVLPNAPALIHPGRNPDQLIRKRNRLLARLRDRAIIDSLTCYLAQQEPLPEAPQPLPTHAPHLLERIHQHHHRSSQIESTIDYDKQVRANNVVNRFHKALRNNGVHNIATLVTEVATGQVIVYIGNTPQLDNIDHGHAVDITTAPRSSGSILKPLLYANMLHDGELLPYSLVPDIPSNFNGYVPVNFNRTYLGSVPADQALARSLNIPAVRMLHDYGVGKFYDRLNAMGISTLHRPPGDYGLTLILGGAEVTLEDMTHLYTGMVQQLLDIDPLITSGNAYQNGNLVYTRTTKKNQAKKTPKANRDVFRLGKYATWYTFEAMLAVTRPNMERYWQQFSSTQKIAWKTGTSFGARDAWSIGCTPEYVVSVWVGNADGEGRPGLSGLHAAAPIMFELFQILPSRSDWFSPPTEELVEVTICAKSGMLATSRCPTTPLPVSPVGQYTSSCNYHKYVWVDSTHSHQLHSECASPNEMQRVSWFVLPPIQEHYYKVQHPGYRTLPPFSLTCQNSRPTLSNQSPMELIYPRQATKIYVPKDLDGKSSSTVFEVTHRRSNVAIYWHLDQTFIGTTTDFHQMALNPDPGPHKLTWVDEEGNSLHQSFEIIAQSKP